MENPPQTRPLKERYAARADADGYLPVMEFATSALGRQTKNIAALLDGEEGTNPKHHLGTGLRYAGSSGSYYDMRIHIDDVDEFARRVKIHYKEA